MNAMEGFDSMHRILAKRCHESVGLTELINFVDAYERRFKGTTNKISSVHVESRLLYVIVRDVANHKNKFNYINNELVLER